MSKAGQGLPGLAADRALALTLAPISDNILIKLDKFVDHLLQWQRKINLVAPSTLPHLWTRHIADSLQLLDLVPAGPLTWVDFGSGGGFPGIPIACALAERSGSMVHLIESNGKKSAFLREAVRNLELPATVHAQRAEDFGETWPETAQVLSARALAPLKLLCDQAFPLINRGAIGLFPKGQDVDAELTEAAKYWSIQAEMVPSRTSPDGRIVVVRGLERRAATAPAKV